MQNHVCNKETKHRTNNKDNKKLHASCIHIMQVTQPLMLTSKEGGTGVMGAEFENGPNAAAEGSRPPNSPTAKPVRRNYLSSLHFADARE